MSVGKLAVIAAFVAFLAGFFWTLNQYPLSAATGEIVSNPWTIIIAADDILGFVLFSVIIAFSERTVMRAVFWIVPMFLIGHIVAAIYLIGNYERIRSRLTREE